MLENLYYGWYGSRRYLENERILSFPLTSESNSGSLTTWKSSYSMVIWKLKYIYNQLSFLGKGFLKNKIIFIPDLNIFVEFYCGQDTFYKDFLHYFWAQKAIDLQLCYEYLFHFWLALERDALFRTMIRIQLCTRKRMLFLP